MRSSVAAAAAFAAGAVAVPHHMHKPRAVVTDWDVVYVTNVVTVTEGAEPAAAPTSTVVQNQNYNHHWHWSTWSAPAPVEPTTSIYVAPTTSTYVAPTTSSSEWIAPEPTTSYVAPPPSSTYVAPTTSQAPSSSAAQPSASPSDYNGQVVYHHNLHRSNHSAPAIEWDDGLASTAAKIASSCQYAHDTKTDGGGYGQNIAAGPKGSEVNKVITDLFYNGEVGWYDGLYGLANPDMTNFEKWGHFSQIVWKGTTHVGCATQDCSSQGLGNVNGDVPPYFTVCNYKTPGNYAGEYGTNVGKSLNKETVSV